MRITTPKPPITTINIFSSHAWRYGDHRTGLHSLLSQEWVKGLDYRDFSIPSAHPEDADADAELMDLLAERISFCDVVLVFAAMYADRPWIRDELTAARTLGKPIIALKPWGQRRLSKWALRFASEPPVGWQGNSIRQAILRHVPEIKRSGLLSQISMRKSASLPTFTALPNPLTRPPGTASGNRPTLLGNALAPLPTKKTLLG